MPTRSPRISRPTHKTRTGRVVYDRPVHVFELRDLLRISRKLELPYDVTKLFEALQVIFELLMKIFKLWMNLTPWGEIWWRIAGTIKNWITTLWATLVNGSNPPKEKDAPKLS
jgi:hypothetical protein